MAGWLAARAELHVTQGCKGLTIPAHAAQQVQACLGMLGLKREGESVVGVGDDFQSCRAFLVYRTWFQNPETGLKLGMLPNCWLGRIVHSSPPLLQVAIKKVLQDKRFKNRELQIMKMMDHCNVVQLKHCFYSTTEKDEVGHTPGVML